MERHLEMRLSSFLLKVNLPNKQPLMKFDNWKFAAKGIGIEGGLKAICAKFGL